MIEFLLLTILRILRVVRETATKKWVLVAPPAAEVKTRKGWSTTMTSIDLGSRRERGGVNVVNSNSASFFRYEGTQGTDNKLQNGSVSSLC